MKLFSLLKAIPLSFYSRSLYQDIGRNWRGLGLTYLLLLVALTWLPYTYVWHKAVVYFADNTAPAIITQLPTIHVAQGKLTTDQLKPYLIKDLKTAETLAIIDTTGQYTSLDHTSAVLLVTSDKLLYRSAPDKTTEHSLSGIQNNYRLDQATITANLNELKTYFAIICFIVGTLGFFILRVIQTLLGSIIGAILANAKTVLLPYSAVMRLSAVALTPAIIFATVLDFMHRAFPYQGLAKVVIALIYIYFAIKANATEKQEA